MNKLLIATGLIGLLSGCSTMNESFTCNQTAGDSCLTIDAVNAMTEPKGTYTKHRIIKSANEDADKSSLWIAAWQDAQGHQHDEKTLVLS
jgi:conjugal transfer pilus assembly protein TraV